MRTYGVAPHVAVPYHPLYLLPGHLGQGAPSPVVSSADWGGRRGVGLGQSDSTSQDQSQSSKEITAAVQAGLTIVTSLLAAHAKRLQDAKNENAAAAQAVPSFYSTVQQIVQALNSGQIAASDAISALEQLDEITYQSLRAYVGQPGTAWNSSTPGVCNSSCTVGCCLYTTYLHPDLFGASGKQGVIPVIEQGGGQVNIGNIPTNKYGFPSYGQITLTINPSAVAMTVDPVTGAVTSVSGGDGSGLLWLGLAAVAAFFVMR